MARTMKARERESIIYSEYAEQFQALALIVLLLLIIDILLLERDNPLFKNVSIFKKRGQEAHS